MNSISRRPGLNLTRCMCGLALFLVPLARPAMARQAAQRPTITAVIVLREQDKVTLNRGEQDGLRKGDRMRVSHYINGKLFVTGSLVVIKVYGTTCIAKITEQTGALGLEDEATFEPASPAPAAPPRRAATDPARTPVQQPVTVTPAQSPRKGTTPPVAAPTLEVEPARKPEAPLPLLPQFSGDSAGGASFSLDFTNEGEKVIDTSAFRLSARLTLDGQDYRVGPTLLAGNFNLAPGKVRSFSFNLTDFTVAADKDVWPLKAGRHTVTIRFGGKQYGPLTFEWRGDNTAK